MATASSEVSVAVADEAADTGFDAGRKLPIVAATAFAGTEPRGTILAITERKSLDPAPRQAKPLSRAPNSDI
ncbi:hypothetical protein SAMN05216345_1014 [Cupriavidus sp. YR651]|nr:hypothetical protein SAMN05216345_1014 [Cupriavidus sp. YR651]